MSTLWLRTVVANRNGSTKSRCRYYYAVATAVLEVAR